MTDETTWPRPWGEKKWTTPSTLPAIAEPTPFTPSQAAEGRASLCCVILGETPMRPMGWLFASVTCSGVTSKLRSWPPRSTLTVTGTPGRYPWGRAGVPSVPVGWNDVARARPELLVLAPCGFSRERAQAEAALVRDRIDAVGAERVLVLDGSAYFNRPGPRLVDSLEVLVAGRLEPVAKTTDRE